MKVLAAVFPHDDILHHYIKLLGNELVKEGFELSLQHRDSGGIDVFTYRDALQRCVSIARKMLPDDQQELRISSEWEGIPQAIDAAVKSFNENIIQSIEKGLSA